MNFWKTSFWATLSTVARLASQFVVAKLIAVVGGPATFGIVGQFQSFVSLLQLSNGGIVSSGVTKYSAEYSEAPDKLSKLANTALKFGFAASIMTGIFVVIFSKFLSAYIFQSLEYRWILVAFGLTLFGYTFNQIVLSIFNGLNQMKKYAAISIIGAVLSVILIGWLGYLFSTQGVLLAFILSQVILFGVGLFFLKKTPIRLQLFAPSIDRVQLKQLLSFSLMSVTSVIATPMAQLFLRNYVAVHSSWAEVGHWQAMVRISDAYLMIITMIISTYALPKYARISCNKELATEISHLFKRLIPIAVGMAGGIYILKKYIILILFSPEFLVMKPLFLYQLIGDVFKISSWIMANVMVAKAKIKVYIALEIIFTVSFVLLSVLFFQHSGIKGLSMAFCLNYIGYFFATGAWLYFFLKLQRCNQA